MTRRTAILPAILIPSITLSARDAFCLGSWKIVSAVAAPWWDHPKSQPDPRYQIKDYPADWLFQGSFGEMHDRDKSVDPVKLAVKFGFKGSTWKTLITGCADELEYHFIDPDTAAIGLDNYIYTLKKQR